MKFHGESFLCNFNMTCADNFFLEYDFYISEATSILLMDDNSTEANFIDSVNDQSEVENENSTMLIVEEIEAEIEIKNHHSTPEAQEHLTCDAKFDPQNFKNEKISTNKFKDLEDIRNFSSSIFHKCHYFVNIGWQEKNLSFFHEKVLLIT